MAQLIFLSIGNLFLIGVSMRYVLKKKMLQQAWRGGLRHLMMLLLALVVLAIFCGLFVLMNSLEANKPLTQSFMKGAVAGLYVMGAVLLAFVILFGFLPVSRQRRDFPPMSSKMFH